VIENEPGPVVRHRIGGRSARVREAVFAATLATLAESGLEQLSIANLAALYEQVAEAMPIPDTGSVRTDLIALLGGALRYLRSPLGSAVVRTSVALPPSDEASALRRAFWARRFPEALTILARGAERGELAPGIDHQLVLEQFIGVFHLRVFVIDDPNDEDLPERLVDLVLNGAAARSA
jgi:hypothetical protein